MISVLFVPSCVARGLNDKSPADPLGQWREQPSIARWRGRYVHPGDRSLPTGHGQPPSMDQGGTPDWPPLIPLHSPSCLGVGFLEKAPRQAGIGSERLLAGPWLRLEMLG